MNGAWVLPRTEQHEALFTQLADTVRSQRGIAVLLMARATSTAEREEIIAGFQADRAREYSAFAERAGAFLAEVERETGLEKFTFAELEELEDDLQKLAAWLDKIQGRDFFPDHGLQDATDTRQRCEADLRAFAEIVYAREGVHPSADDEDSELKPA